jgi:hypothetical protein
VISGSELFEGKAECAIFTALIFDDEMERFVFCASLAARIAVTGPCVAENEPIAAGNKKIPTTQISVSNAVRKFRQAGIELSTSHPTQETSGAPLEQH